MSERLAQASVLAETLHRGQVRKGTTIPYVSHLYAVASLLLEWGAEEDVVVAGFLHDAVEDCGGAPVAELIRERFGSRVADAVLACSDSLSEASHTKADWLTRKQAHVAHAASFSPDAALVTAADKLHNVRSLVADLDRHGSSVLARFKAPEHLCWYYTAMAEAVSITIPVAASEELRRSLRALAERLANLEPQPLQTSAPPCQSL